MTTTASAASTDTALALRTGHVGLNVTDLDRSQDFYTQVLGLEVQGAGNEPERRWVFLGRDGQLLITLWQQSGGRFPTDRPGLHHLSFQVESVEQVQAVQATLHGLSAQFA